MKSPLVRKKIINLNKGGGYATLEFPPETTRKRRCPPAAIKPLVEEKYNENKKNNFSIIFNNTMHALSKPIQVYPATHARLQMMTGGHQCPQTTD